MIKQNQGKDSTPTTYTRMILQTTSKPLSRKTCEVEWSLCHNIQGRNRHQIGKSF